MNVGDWRALTCVLFYNKYYLALSWEGFRAQHLHKNVERVSFQHSFRPADGLWRVPFHTLSSSSSHSFLISVLVAGTSHHFFSGDFRSFKYYLNILLHDLHANVSANAICGIVTKGFSIYRNINRYLE